MRTCKSCDYYEESIIWGTCKANENGCACDIYAKEDINNSVIKCDRCCDKECYFEKIELYISGDHKL